MSTVFHIRDDRNGGRFARLLSFLLAVLLCLTGLPICTRAATVTYVSNQNGKDGLLDYGNTTVDYIIPYDKLRLAAYDSSTSATGHKNVSVATVIFEKKVNGAWVTDPKPPFGYSHTTEPYFNSNDAKSMAKLYYNAANGGEWGENGKSFPNNRIRIIIPDAALGSDGEYHDITMTISNMFFKAKGSSGATVDNFIFINQTVSASGGFGFASSRLNESDPYGGTTYDVNISVSGATSSQKLFLMFSDLDVPGFNGYEGGFATKDCLEGVRIKSGIYPGTQPHVPKDHILRIEDSATPTYYGTESASGSDSYRAAMSYLANATGTTFQWAGCGAGTTFSLRSSELSSFTINTRVRTETASSPVSGTKTYGSWSEIDSKWFLSLMSATYSHTYSKTNFMNDQLLTSPADDWIFDYLGKTIGGSGIREDKTYSITIDRNRYTYSFNANPPSDRSVSDVSNMPTNKTVVAAKEASGKSDATVKSPTLSGYIFKGWNTKANGTGTAYPGAETMKSSKTFYAQWQRGTYKVHFNANSSSNPNHQTGESTQNTVTGTMSDQTLEFDVAANLNENRFVREGYTFAGWNTKANGTGTSYSNKQSVTNLIGYDRSEITLYAQWRKKPGSETITIVSEETGNPVKDVSMKLQKRVNGSWTDVLTGITNANGQIIVNDLHWFNYRWVMTDVPAGYTKSADTGFTIHYNQLSSSDQVILYMKHVSIILDSQVSDVIKGENAPAFLYHIRGTDAAGVRHEYNLLVQTNVSSGFGTSRLTDLFAGTYEITQTQVSRYRAGTAVNISHAVSSGINATADVLNHDTAEVRFPYTIEEYGWYSGTDSEINHLKGGL